MIVNKAALVALETSFQTIFTEALHGASSSTMWPKFATRFPNTAAALDLNWIAAIPGMKKMAGAAQLNNLELVKWSIDNEEFEDTIALKVKDIERDQIGIYTPRLQMLAGAGARHPDQLLGALMLAGFSTKDYTGKNFFDTGKKHFPGVKAGTTFDNKITDALDSTSFKAARTMLKTMKIVFPDGSETKLNLGTDLTLIVSPTNEDVARQILTAEQIDGTSNTLRGAAKLEVWGELGDSAAWFLMDGAYPIKPFAFSDEKPVSLTSCTNLQDSHVLLNKEFIYQAYSRGNMGYTLPQLCVGSTGAD